MFFRCLFCISFVIEVFGIRGDLYLFANQSINRPIVSTTSGNFSGFTIRQTNVWIGVPYAAPPIGQLRWQKAQPYIMTAGQNNTIQNATHYGPWCPQISRPGFPGGPFDEDCLYLNIWAPRIPSNDSAGYPVMIWIHGGGLQERSSTEVSYDGLDWTNNAIENNKSFIMVSINYRLNVFGFFAQTGLIDNQGKIIANQGISDQRVAIKWIRDNIEQFGGNKNAITLMGQSGGSQSICTHIISPLSINLFSTGILESGTCDTYLSLRDSQFAYATANELALRVGCNITNSTQQLACLRTINSTLLISAALNLSIPLSNTTAFKDQSKIILLSPFSLIVDEVEIPIHPLKAFLSGNFNRNISLLIGANRDEFLLRAIYEASHAPISLNDYLNRVLPIATYNNTQIQALYHPNNFDGNYTKAFVAFVSQGYFLCNARRMAGYMTGQSVYLYTYEHTLEYFFFSIPELVLWPGAFHTAELFPLFQTLSYSLQGNNIFYPDELNLTRSIRNYWTNMITTGQPNDNHSLIWPQYLSTTDQAMVLNKTMITTSFINLYPNCDSLSKLLVEIFGEYLGLSATCTAGNKCFITTVPNSSTSTTTTTSTVVSTTLPTTKTTTKNGTLRYCQFDLFLLLILFCLLLIV